MTNSWIIAIAAVFTLSSAVAGTTQWEVDKVQSQILFAGTFEGATFEGRFTEYSALLQFDPDNLAASRFDVHIQVDSADTGSGDLNDGMLLPEWFDAKQYPQATFVSTEIQQRGEDHYLAIGKLSLKGVTREVALPYTWSMSGNRATITGKATFNRADFAIGEGEWSDGSIVGLPVTVSTRLILTRANP
ncbi:YceI family protein [Sedimenticola sp.]|uniref:YceI family protein n=1 Tax=Sedimenticola sp. TaxID=1940285 RepID=UPI003D11ADF1